MSDIQTKQELAKLSKNLEHLPTNMRLFSLSMRSLYAENAFSSDSSANKIRGLRDEVRMDAMVYIKGILPVSTEVVKSIKEFFEYYEELDYQEWQENLVDILEEVKGYRECCTEVIKLHKKIMVPLKQKQDRAKEYMAELVNLTKEYAEKKAQLEESASSNYAWANVLFWVPAINLIAYPLLKSYAESDLAAAVAKGQQCIINDAAILVVSETMMPALSAFIDGLDGMAGFFSVVEKEIASFQGKGEKSLEDAKRLHFTMMKKKAIEIKKGCTAFYAMIPGVQTDFECIPEHPDDKNYVDRWLQNQKEEIERAYSMRLSTQLKKMITSFFRWNASYPPMVTH